MIYRHRLQRLLLTLALAGCGSASTLAAMESAAMESAAMEFEAPSGQGTGGSLMILGWVEFAKLVEPGIELKAKLDSGAKTSSLDARIIKRFRQYGKRWVRFAVRHPETGEETILVRERERTIQIVQHEGPNETRPTVNIEICIAGVEREIEVSLVDRENFNYPLLLGRRTLKHIAVVHPGETFISDSVCSQAPEPQGEPEPKPTTEESSGEVQDDEQSVDAVESSGEDEVAGSEEERVDESANSRKRKREQSGNGARKRETADDDAVDDQGRNGE